MARERKQDNAQMSEDKDWESASSDEELVEGDKKAEEWIINIIFYQR